MSGSVNSHWKVVAPAQPVLRVDLAAHGVEHQRDGLGVPLARALPHAEHVGFGQRAPALGQFERAQPGRQQRRARQALDGDPGGAQLGRHRGHALDADLVVARAEDRDVAFVPAGRHQDLRGVARHVAQQRSHGPGHAHGVFAIEVAQQLDAEADVALLVGRDVLHALAEGGQLLALFEVAADEVLPGLCERGLDHHVVERDGRGQLRGRAVLAQLVGHRVEAVEDLAEAGAELRTDRLQPARDGAVADPADLLHEALEEDRVARLVDLLGRQEVLLLLARGGVDVGGEVVGDGVLAPEEQAVVPYGGLSLEVREVLAPLARVLGEVELGRLPVAALPARVQVLVGDRVRRQRAEGGAGGSRAGHLSPISLG